MRDFLYSEVAEVHGISNVPDDAELAVRSGRALCRNLLEPLRRVFGHVTIRSAFRSVHVDGYCNRNGTVNLTWRGDPDDAAKDGDVRQFDGSSDSMVWGSKPKRRVLSHVPAKGLFFGEGKPKEGRWRSEDYVELLHYLCSGDSGGRVADFLRNVRKGKRVEDIGAG